MALRRAKKVGRGRKWKGGHVHHEVDGLEVFIIERQVNGRRFHVSTRCNDEGAALHQLARFEANPLAYDPAGTAPERGLVMDVELISEFYAWQTAPKKAGGKANSRHYAKESVRKLRDWMEALGTRDLRRLRLVDLKACLARWPTSRQHRIIAIKVFYGWLRTEKSLLTHAQDATLDLLVPQADPEKHRRRKVVPWAVVQAVYVHLAPRVRDVLQLFAATGWHISEVERFVRLKNCSIEDPGEVTYARDGSRVLAVLVTWHKSKHWTRTSLTHQGHLDAARRLKAEGKMPRKLNDAIAAAATLAGVEPFTLGVMRHSVATWSIGLGASSAEAAVHLDHADKRTTEKFYLDIMVPRPPIPTRVLDVEGGHTVN